MDEEPESLTAADLIAIALGVQPAEPTPDPLEDDDPTHTASSPATAYFQGP